MSEWIRYGAAMAAAGAVALLAACGGGTDRTKAHVRLVNASSGYNALALTIGSTALASAVAYGASPSYSDASASDTNASITNAGSATALASTTVSTSKNGYYTMLAYGKAGALSSLLLDDGSANAGSGKALLRVINTASDAGALDVYVTGSSDTLAQSTTLQASLAYGNLSSFTTLNSGSWRVRVTAAGSKTDLRLDLASLVFDSAGVHTLVLTPGRGGVLVNALLLTQQGGITQGANGQARMRVVAGVNGTAAVTATVGGTALMSGVAPPTRTDYVLVSAGTPSVAVRSNNSSAALSTASLAGGGDYTLLVYGPANTPVATVIEDDNSLPSLSGYGKLRLVHGVDGVGGSLSLKVNFLLTADSVAPGTASAYFAQAATTTARLDVSSSDGALAAYSSTANEITAGRVYTLFMVGGAAAAVGILAPDR